MGEHTGGTDAPSFPRESPLLHGLPPSTLTQNTMTHTQDSAPPAPQTHLPQPESTPTVLSQHTVQSPTKVGSAPYRTRSGRICKPNSRYEQWVLLMVNLVALWFLYMLNVFIMYLLFLYWQYHFFVYVFSWSILRPSWDLFLRWLHCYNEAANLFIVKNVFFLSFGGFS